MSNNATTPNPLPTQGGQTTVSTPTGTVTGIHVGGGRVVSGGKSWWFGQ